MVSTLYYTIKYIAFKVLLRNYRAYYKVLLIAHIFNCYLLLLAPNVIMRPVNSSNSRFLQEVDLTICISARLFNFRFYCSLYLINIPLLTDFIDTFWCDPNLIRKIYFSYSTLFEIDVEEDLQVESDHNSDRF